MYQQRNLNRPKNIGTGVAEVLYLAPVSWFQSIAFPKPPYENRGDEVRVLEDHIFKPGKGFIKISLAPFKNQITAKYLNQPPSATFEQQLTAIIPGSYALLHETIKNLNNTPLIAIIGDANCSEGVFYQFGNDCAPAYTFVNFSTGTTKDGIKAYELTITWTNQFVMLYEGLISQFVPEQPAGSSFFLANLGTHDIDGNASQLQVFYDAAATTDITQIYQLLVVNADEAIIQLSIANSEGENISDIIVGINLTSQETFVTVITEWLAANSSGKLLQVSGTQLLLIDSDTTLSFYGTAVPVNLLGDDVYILEDWDGDLLVTE